MLFTKLLMAALALHVAGALKHHLIDRDATLRRMLPGRAALPALAPMPARRHAFAPALGALALYGVAGALAVTAAAGGGGRAPACSSRSRSPRRRARPSSWVVETGSLSFSVAQDGRAP